MPTPIPAATFDAALARVPRGATVLALVEHYGRADLSLSPALRPEGYGCSPEWFVVPAAPRDSCALRRSVLAVALWLELGMVELPAGLVDEAIALGWLPAPARVEELPRWFDIEERTAEVEVTLAMRALAERLRD